METEVSLSTSQQESTPVQASSNDFEGLAYPPSSAFATGSVSRPFEGDSFLAEGASSTDTSIQSMAINQSDEIKAMLEYQIKIIQRQLQEYKNSSRIENSRLEKISKESTDAIKTSLLKYESKLASLQKVIASQSDKTTQLRKEFSDGDTVTKAQIEELMKKSKDHESEINDIKSKCAELIRKVNSGSGLPSGGGAANFPENIQQIIEAYERQLGMYDVRIAELDSRFQILESTSFSGTLVWKIRDYPRRKHEAIVGKTLSLYSQPFYTSRYGYKMCARIYLNGDGMGKGTHMSLFFVVMKGEYDALLPWPFRQKVTLMLLDQGVDRRHLSDTFRPDPTSSSFKRPTSDMNIASGCPLFVAHSVVDESTYIREETIFLRIHVDTSDLDNW